MMSLAILRGYRGCQKLPVPLLVTTLKGLRCESTAEVGNRLRPCFAQSEACQPERCPEESNISAWLHCLSLSPAELNMNLKYILPTTSGNLVLQKGHIFNRMHHNIVDCPTRLGNVSVVVPGSVISITQPDLNPEIQEPTDKPAVGKLAKNVLKIRRRKMNRHHLKKLRKRMKFVFRKRLHRKNKLKEEKVQAEFREIMKRAEDFDPEKFVQENLEQARKGGFRLDIFAPYRQKD